MNKPPLWLVAIAALSISPLAEAQDNWTCLNSADAVEAFNSGDMKRASNYSEAEYGGVRVQREHPETFMFAQAKFIKGDERSAAICQYSNHVGLVATYLILDVGTVIGLEVCKTSKCRKKPHWRSEWTESKDEGPNGQDRMHVCMVLVDGLERPSSKCEFTGFTK